jgi:hypothetical protein
LRNLRDKVADRPCAGDNDIFARDITQTVNRMDSDRDRLHESALIQREIIGQGYDTIRLGHEILLTASVGLESPDL